MVRAGNYVVMRNVTGMEIPVVFSGPLCHRDMVAALQLIHAGMVPVSAGYLIAVAFGKYEVRGGCPELKLKARPQDLAVLHEVISNVDQHDARPPQSHTRSTSAQLLGIQPDPSGGVIKLRGYQFLRGNVLQLDTARGSSGVVSTPSEIAELTKEKS